MVCLCAPFLCLSVSLFQDHWVGLWQGGAGELKVRIPLPGLKTLTLPVVRALAELRDQVSGKHACLSPSVSVPLGLEE